MAKEAIAKVTQDVEDHMSDPWSDWDVVETEGFQALSQRVEELEAGTATGPASNSETVGKKIDDVLTSWNESRSWRVKALKGTSEVPRGGFVRISPRPWWSPSPC